MLNQAFCPASALVSADKDKARKPSRFKLSSVVSDLGAWSAY
jgi:hypothetical protein